MLQKYNKQSQKKIQSMTKLAVMSLWLYSTTCSSRVGILKYTVIVIISQKILFRQFISNGSIQNKIST